MKYAIIAITLVLGFQEWQIKTLEKSLTSSLETSGPLIERVLILENFQELTLSRLARLEQTQITSDVQSSELSRELQKLKKDLEAEKKRITLALRGIFE